MTKQENIKIGIVGLGYVGLPLAVEFAKKLPVVGFDINSERVSDLRNSIDHTLEVNSQTLNDVNVKSIDALNIGSGFFHQLKLTMLNHVIFIITVPTPVDKFNRLVLTPLLMASKTVGSILKKGIM